MGKARVCNKSSPYERLHVMLSVILKTTNVRIIESITHTCILAPPIIALDIPPCRTLVPREKAEHFHFRYKCQNANGPFEEIKYLMIEFRRVRFSPCTHTRAYHHHLVPCMWMCVLCAVCCVLKASMKVFQAQRLSTQQAYPTVYNSI